MPCCTLQKMSSKLPLSSCRNGTPVVLMTSKHSQVPARLTVTTIEAGESVQHVVKVSWPSWLVITAWHGMAWHMKV